MDSKPFMAAVKRERIARRWSLSKAARQADIDRITWGRIEQGLNVHELSIYATLAAVDLDFDELLDAYAEAGKDHRAANEQ